ncbi:DUF2934 domain-containing protein [Rhizobium metallidurans]|uniref:DUF2934 domain-containing protein n=1 Tax=Rhizobium metallidurans TaxID=1265931 RepID=A0A7W6CRH4_9HYPH|nr:DUF2934 domain-containing protein [Rhizobium metallidurans]MBB3965867.1 hypothetical protein [Rhizobium metallidurans]
MSTIESVSDRESLKRRIEMRAYDIWLHEGCQHGHDLGHWLKAESELAAAAAPENTEGQSPSRDKK